MNDLKEAVILILEILSSAGDPFLAMDENHSLDTAQYVIDLGEIDKCKELLDKIKGDV